LPNTYLAHLCRNFFSGKPNCASYEIEQLYDKSRVILQIDANVSCRSITLAKPLAIYHIAVPVHEKA